MGGQANEHSEPILPRKFQSSYSSAVEFSVQHERLCSIKSVASEYSTVRESRIFVETSKSRPTHARLRNRELADEAELVSLSVG